MLKKIPCHLWLYLLFFFYIALLFAFFLEYWVCVHSPVWNSICYLHCNLQNNFPAGIITSCWKPENSNAVNRILLLPRRVFRMFFTRCTMSQKKFTFAIPCNWCSVLIHHWDIFFSFSCIPKHLLHGYHRPLLWLADK